EVLGQVVVAADQVGRPQQSVLPRPDEGDVVGTCARARGARHRLSMSVAYLLNAPDRPRGWVALPTFFSDPFPDRPNHTGGPLRRGGMASRRDGRSRAGHPRARLVAVPRGACLGSAP